MDHNRKTCETRQHKMFLCFKLCQLQLFFHYIANASNWLFICYDRLYE